MPHIRIDYQFLDREFRNTSLLELGVLLMLRRYQNRDSGLSWPSEALLAEKMGLSLPTVRKGIKALVKRGIISIHREKTKRGFRNVYTFLYGKDSFLP